MAEVLNFGFPVTKKRIPNTEILTKIGSGGGDDGMETKVAKLEASVGHIQTDIADIKSDIRDMRKELTSGLSAIRKEFFLALIFATLGLASLLAKGFNWI